jgi:hypothetical protein
LSLHYIENKNTSHNKSNPINPGHHENSTSSKIKWHGSPKQHYQENIENMQHSPTNPSENHKY